MTHSSPNFVSEKKACIKFLRVRYLTIVMYYDIAATCSGIEL